MRRRFELILWRGAVVHAIVILGLAGSLAGAEPEIKTNAPAPRKAVILFLPCEQPPRFPDRVARELGAEGFVLAGHTLFEDLTLDYLRQFNAVVINQQTGETQPVTDQRRKGFAALRAYVDEGGGLLVTKYLYSQRAQALFKELLAPLGVEVLVEQIVDETNIYRKTSYGSTFTFAWTDRITPHAATKDVTGLAYNLDRAEEGEPSVLPLKVDDKWQVLIRGMPSAATFLPRPATFGKKATEVSAGPGTYARSPPLLAVREFGKGRVAVWPTLMTFTLKDGYSIILENGIVMDSRQGDKQSNGARLTYNLLHWLSEPSLAMENFGRYTPPPLPPPPPPDLGFVPVDWSKTNDFGPSFSRAYMGLIGARTGLSTGEGTPEEFIAAAQKAGYDFIAFCEDINAMPRENWDKLVTACDKATTTNFLALPGIYYLDNEGDAFVVLGNIGYPPPAWADPKNPKKKILYNGTLRLALKVIPPIIMLPLPANKRPARYHSSFYGYAFQVWEDGKLVENWKDYVELQKEGLALFPTAVHIAKKPGDVIEARSQGLQAYVRADSLDKLMESIDGLTSAHYRYYKPAYPSSGPEICTFMAVNWGTSDLAVPGNDRFRLQMLARSPKGLAEVQLFERGTLIRRFLLNGAKEFKQTLDEYHTQQRSFLMVVINVDGGKALSWDRKTEVQECWFGMCGDNMNDMGGGKISIDTGILNLLGIECWVTPSGPGSTWPWPSIAARLVDGDGSRLKTKPEAAMKDCSLVSRFGMVVNYPLDYNWDGVGTVHLAYPAPLIINPCLGGSYRAYIFVRRPPGPDLEIREYTINIKQDMELIETPGLKLMSGANWKLEEGRLDHIVYFTPQGGRVVESPTRETGEQFNILTVKPGQYVSIYPTCTAVFPLDEEMYASIDRNPVEPFHTTLQVGIGAKGDKLRKGDVIRKRLAVLSLPFSPQGEYSWLPEYKRYWNSNLLAEDVREKLGLAGPPAYQVTPSVGKVLDTRLVLRLQAEKYGFRGLIAKCHLPMALPALIEGLNPLWSAGVWYKGTNTLLQTEWPPNYFKGNPSHRRYVQERVKTDEIIRIGTFDNGIGFLQLDAERGDRDIFIGNLVTCNREDFPLVFHRDGKTGQATIEVHNPTDKEAKVTVKPGKGFDLYGDFSNIVSVPAGSSIIITVSKLLQHN